MILLVDVADRADARAGQPPRRQARRQRRRATARAAPAVRQKDGDIRRAPADRHVETAPKRPSRTLRAKDGRNGRPAGNRGDVRRTHRAQAALSAIESSASAIASGVPTWSHSPSMRTPKRRPASMARSKSRLSENGPAGASAKRRGMQDGGAGIDEGYNLAFAAAEEPAGRDPSGNRRGRYSQSLSPSGRGASAHPLPGRPNRPPASRDWGACPRSRTCPN